MTVRPRLALVSTGVRRDLLTPLRHFRAFELLHYYRQAEYGDLAPADYIGHLQRYHSPVHLYRELVRARPDVIQGVEPLAGALQPYLWAGYWAAKRVAARLVVVTLENRPPTIKFGVPFALWLRLTLPHYFARACLIIPLNAGAQRNALAYGAPSARLVKTMWGTWGVDLEEFTPAVGQKAAAPTVLYVGRLHPEKGVVDLLQAFALVREQLPELRLKLIGDGPQRAHLEQLSHQLGVDAAVTFTGVLKNRELPPHFQAATVFILPSVTTRKWEEQVGMAALQALACGLPVVATRSGALPEYLPEGQVARLTPERDPQALAQTILALLRDEGARLALGQAARAYAEQHYDERQNVARAEQLLQERCREGRF